MLRLSLITVFFALQASILIASADILTPDYAKCMDGKDQSNAGWSRCGKEELSRQEKKLTEVWAALSKNMGTLSKKDFESLSEEQDLWAKWKNLACEYYYREIDFGHEKKALGHYRCKAEIVAERVNYLSGLNSDLQYIIDR